VALATEIRFRWSRHAVLFLWSDQSPQPFGAGRSLPPDVHDEASATKVV